MLATVTLAQGLDPTTIDPAQVDAYLTAKGYAVAGSAVHFDGTVTVNIDRDPGPDGVGITPPPTPAQQAVATAVAALKSYNTTIRAIPQAQRTPEQTALLAILVVLKNTLTPS